MRKRSMSYEKYGISRKRYKELCGFCEQYPEWKDELRKGFGLRSPEIDGMPHGSGGKSDRTADTAMRRYTIQQKVDLIEKTAREVSSEMAEYIIKSACYEIPYWYLSNALRIPISDGAFRDLKRYFFYLLHKRL